MICKYIIFIRIMQITRHKLFEEKMKEGTLPHAKPLFQDNCRDNTSSFEPAVLRVKIPCGNFSPVKNAPVSPRQLKNGSGLSVRSRPMTHIAAVVEKLSQHEIEIPSEKSVRIAIPLLSYLIPLHLLYIV